LTFFIPDLTFAAPGESLTRRGSFHDTVFDWPQVETRDYFNKNPYAAYEYADNARTEFTNPGAPIAKKVLVMGDSYSNVPVCYLSLCFQSVVDLDPRYFREDFEAFWADYQPDIILLLTTASSVSNVTLMEYFSP
jgi:hypothetical protein